MQEVSITLCALKQIVELAETVAATHGQDEQDIAIVLRRDHEVIDDTGEFEIGLRCVAEGYRCDSRGQYKTNGIAFDL